MARKTAQLQYNRTGQTLVERVLQGRPSAVTFDVFGETASDDSTAEFSGTGTVDTPNTTVDVASGKSGGGVSGVKDPHRINVASTAGMLIGRKLLLGENAMKEWVEPIEIVTDDYIRVRHALRNDYTTAATLVSTFVSGAVDATWIADKNNLCDHSDPNPDWRIRWQATVAGVVHTLYSLFDVVRSPVSHGVTIEDVARGWSALLDQLPDEHQADRGRALIEAGWRMVRAELGAISLDEQGLYDPERVDELTVRATRLILAEDGIHPPNMDPLSFLASTRSSWERFWEKNYQITLTGPVRTGGDGNASRPTAPAIWSK